MTTAKQAQRTPAQQAILEECEHKACVLLDSPELMESYEIDELDAMEIKTAARDGSIYSLPQRLKEVLAEELKNTADIATDNITYASKNGDYSEARTLKRWRKVLREASSALFKPEV